MEKSLNLIDNFAAFVGSIRNADVNNSVYLAKYFTQN